MSNDPSPCLQPGAHDCEMCLASYTCGSTVEMCVSTIMGDWIAHCVCHACRYFLLTYPSDTDVSDIDTDIDAD